MRTQLFTRFKAGGCFCLGRFIAACLISDQTLGQIPQLWSGSAHLEARSHPALFPKNPFFLIAAFISTRAALRMDGKADRDHYGINRRVSPLPQVSDAARVWRRSSGCQPAGD